MDGWGTVLCKYVNSATVIVLLGRASIGLHVGFVEEHAGSD